MKQIYGIKMQMELAELFRFTLELRGDTTELFAERHGARENTSLEWEYGIGLTDNAVALMQKYVSSDIKCLKAFIEQFKTTHRVVKAMLKSFSSESDDRYDKSREFKANMNTLKRFYSLLNEYERKYILRGYDAYIGFEANIDTVDLIFRNDMTKCKRVSLSYQLAFMRARNDFNDLLKLYGVNDIITISDRDE